MEQAERRRPPMKIPKYILKHIEARGKAAEKFCEHDYIISRWCNKNEIETEQINGYVDSVVNPEQSNKQLIKDIRAKR